MIIEKSNRHTTTELATFTPAEGEVHMDKTKKTLVIGDNSTKGGIQLDSAGSPASGKATTNNGTTDALNLTDSDGTEIAAIDSNGNLDLEGSVDAKGSTNDGTTDVLNLTDSDDAEVAAINSNGDLDLEGSLEAKASTNDGTTDALNLTDSDDAEIAAINSNGLLETGSFQRALTSIYRRYYHVPMDATNPGAAGATWVSPSANTVGGWQLDVATELLEFGADVHADWDGATDMTVEFKFAVNVDNSGGAAEDTVDLKLVAYYAGAGDVATKTQTVEVATVIGASAQYKVFNVDFTLDWDLADNVIEVGDQFGFILNLETDTSEVDNIIMLQGGASFIYSTTHTGIESGDV